ncbi:aldehyde dehydrogenase family protein [Sphingobium tyrosinilyticum]|uniref:aldehyde dehydrogenase family protein n=1 Tax=Sphingobium tyrosinilyticum TaxID=2715436 RepID=UPI0036D2BD36
MALLCKMDCNLIGGEWIAASEPVENRSPSDTGDLIAFHARATTEDVDAAVNAARFALSGWRDPTPQLRADILDQVGPRLIMVNVPSAGVDYHVPFGGRKAAPYGPRDQGALHVGFLHHHQDRPQFRRMKPGGWASCPGE